MIWSCDEDGYITYPEHGSEIWIEKDVFEKYHKELVEESDLIVSVNPETSDWEFIGKKLKPQTFLERLEFEQSELAERTCKLETFLHSEKSKSIDEFQLNLLKQQFSVMAIYNEILIQRISHLKQ